MAQHYSSTGSAVSLAAATQQTRAIHPILFQCWPNVFDADPPLKQYWVIIPCFLGLPRYYGDSANRTVSSAYSKIYNFKTAWRLVSKVCVVKSRISFKPMCASWKYIYFCFLHLYQHIASQLLSMLNIKGDIDQQDLEFVGLHFVESA